MSTSKKPTMSALRNQQRHKEIQAASREDEAPSDAVLRARDGHVSVRKQKEIPQWQQGRRVITAWLLDEQFVRLNNIHVKRRMSIRALIEEAVDDLLLKHGELPVLMNQTLDSD